MNHVFWRCSRARICWRVDDEQGLVRYSTVALKEKTKTISRSSDETREVVHTLAAALKACGKTRDLDKGRRIHLEAVKHGHDSSTFVGSALVDMYGRCGNMVDARKAFERIRRPDVAAWNALIRGYVGNGEASLALQLFSSMRCEADARSFLLAVMGCAALAAKDDGKRIDGKLVKLKWLEEGMKIHVRASRRHFDLEDIFLGNTLIDMYAKCGSMFDARRVFDRMMVHTVISWTALILGYTDNGEPGLALEIFSRMVNEGGCAPNARTFMAAAMAAAITAEQEVATQVEGKPVKLKSLKCGKSLYTEAIKSRCTDIYLANTVVDLYAKCGSMGDAQAAFDSMPCHNVVSWTALMMGYSENCESDSALEVFSRMRAEGVVPDPAAFVTALVATANMVALGTGTLIHADVCRLGLDSNAVISACLLDFHGKCGRVDFAQHLFDSLEGTRKASDMVVTWNSLLNAYSRHGDSLQVFHLFHRMQDEAVQPDEITFRVILTACSHVGLVEKGKSYFRDMHAKYRVKPDAGHYHCMIDILGRANLLNEALELVQSMPFEPDVLSWRTLLAACRKWKNVEIGKVAFEHLVELEEGAAPAYVLMESIYGSRGMWKEQQEIMSKRNDIVMYKKPGQSWWSDDSGTIHTFKAGDNRHPQSEEIVAKLKTVLAKMKDEGYVVDVGSVTRNIPDQEKETSLCGHSEKLAIACALINTAPGRTIRIMKNLRVCNDCHRATAFISKVEQREIICRDASRFHVFRYGSCSCGDFW